MKQRIIKFIYSIVLVATSIIAPAQGVDVPDPLSSLSESQIEQLKQKYGPSAIKAARSEEIALLMLDPYTSVEMGKLKVEYNKSIKELNLTGKTEMEINAEKKRLTQHYHARLKLLIGEEKYAQRQHYVEYKVERKYMKKYGFSADKIATYSHEAFKATKTDEIKSLELSPEIAIMLGELIVSYKTEQERIKKSGTTPESIKSALRFLSESHAKNVRILIGEDKYHIWKDYVDDSPRRAYAKKHGLPIECLDKYSIDAIKIATCQEVKHLSLSPIDALEMCEIKIAYKKSMQGVSPEHPEWKIKKQELKKEYHRSLRQLLGDEKFTQWTEYQNRALERKCTEKYGFTLEQFKKYQDLENRQAVTILRIKSSAMPKDEKRRRIQEAKEEKIESLRQILPAEQFDKWHKAYMENEERKKTSKQ